MSSGIEYGIERNEDAIYELLQTLEEQFEDPNVAQPLVISVGDNLVIRTATPGDAIMPLLRIATDLRVEYWESRSAFCKRM